MFLSYRVPHRYCCLLSLKYTNVSVEPTPDTPRIYRITTSRRWSSSSQTTSTSRSKLPAVVTTYDTSGMAQSTSATSRTSPGTRTPIMACRVKPTCNGSVTATICMTSASMSFCTRCRTAASDSPTSRAIVTKDWRPSSCSSSTMRLETPSRGPARPEVRVGIPQILPDDEIRRQLPGSETESVVG